MAEGTREFGYHWDVNDGLPFETVSEEPGHWVRHVTCGKAHDASRVEVLERYADCNRWKCPNCGGWCDDRPIGWGGSVEPLRPDRRLSQDVLPEGGPGQR
jgi:hypothetical protein